jgi:hypothetical protein
MTKRDPRRSGPASWPAQATALLAATADLLAPNADPETLTDAQLNARIAAAHAAHVRALKLALLRFSEGNAARLNAELEGEEE